MTPVTWETCWACGGWLLMFYATKAGASVLVPGPAVAVTALEDSLAVVVVGSEATSAAVVNDGADQLVVVTTQAQGDTTGQEGNQGSMNLRGSERTIRGGGAEDSSSSSSRPVDKALFEEVAKMVHNREKNGGEKNNQPLSPKSSKCCWFDTLPRPRSNRKARAGVYDCFAAWVATGAEPEQTTNQSGTEEQLPLDEVETHKVNNE